MANKIFIKYMDRARAANIELGTKRSMDWFRKIIRKDRQPRFSNVVEGKTKVTAPEVGKMYTFIYLPKHRKTLPYYDETPLIIVTDVDKYGWSGINVHYLPPVLRAKLFWEIGYNNSSPERIAKMVQEHEMSTAVFKKYLVKQTYSRLMEIPLEEWEIAIQLPYESFIGQTNRNVWNDSKENIKKWK